MLDWPRMLKSGTELGFEPEIILSPIRKPGSRSWIALSTLPEVSFRTSSPDILLADPVNPSFLRSKIPVTTTSSIAFASSFMAILIAFPLNGTLTFCIPTKEKVTVFTFFPLGIVMLKFPAASVIPPIVGLSVDTLTPGRGSPDSSFTRP